MTTLIPRADRVIAPLVSLIVLFLVGCASYATPGRGADMRTFGMTADQQSDASIVKTISKQPLATLPTSIAIVRVQAPGYRSQTAEGWGRGAYSIVTTRDIENGDEALNRLQKLPMVSAVAPMNRLLFPEEFHSDLELRQAAAALHADMVLIYTLDTTFDVQDAAVPLSVVTLGLSPNEVAHVICTASAVIMDTRNGYVYGIAEATEKQSQLASAWTSEAAVDQTRKRVESKAFGMLVGNIGQTWNGVVRQLGTPRQATAE
jgi:hypothetical protein